MSNPRRLEAYPMVYHLLAQAYTGGKRDATVFSFPTKGKAIAFVSRWHSFRKLWMERHPESVQALGGLQMRREEQPDGTWNAVLEDADKMWGDLTEQLLRQLSNPGPEARSNPPEVPPPGPGQTPQADQFWEAYARGGFAAASAVHAPVQGLDKPAGDNHNNNGGGKTRQD